MQSASAPAELAFAAAIAIVCAAAPLFAQENYEIQVYGADTVPAGTTMVELHSNFGFGGTAKIEDGVAPTHHALHETLETTRGLTSWSEVGFYVFTSVQPNHQWEWVGSHIRPRVRAPEEWHWPVGVSLSAEVGYQRRSFSPQTWTLELRPIIDKQLGRWYASFNPTLDKALRADGPTGGFEFSPNAALTFDVTRAVNLGLEYYGELGPIEHFDRPSQQQHQLFAVANLNLAPEWEVNFGYGTTLTRAGDIRLFKLILGRRFGRSR